MDEAYGILINEDARDEWHTPENSSQQRPLFLPARSFTVVIIGHFVITTLSRYHGVEGR